MVNLVSVLKKYFNESSPFQSPDIPSVCRKVDYDKDGNEVVSYVPEDNAKIAESLGDFRNWSLNAMLSAGINPNFSISTGFNSRIEGISQLQAVDSQVEHFISENQSNSNESE